MRVLLVLLALFPLSGCADGPDKTAHWVAGAMVSHVVSRNGGTPLQACAASLAVGVIKEAADSKFGGVVDRKDVWATGAGCVVTWRF